jgi:hypothetical protein
MVYINIDITTTEEKSRLKKVNSSLKGEDAELVHVLHGHVELHLDSATRLDAGDLTALVAREEFSWRNVFCILAVEPAEYLGDEGARHGLEQVDVSSVGAWLGWNVNCAIAADLVTSQEVPVGKSKHQLRPPAHAEGFVGDLEGVVPDYTPVRLL